MRRLISLFLACALLVGVAVAGNSQNKPDPKRIDAIWGVVSSRITHQSDVWFDSGDFSVCVNILRFMAQANPGDFNDATNLGWMLENTDQVDQAVAEYARYQRENPHTGKGPFPLAYFYFYHKAFAKVPPLLEPTLPLNPESNNYRLLAHAYDRLGMLNDSVRVWQALIARHPEDLPAKKNLAQVQSKLGAAPTKK